jgi:hypothetical protein
MYQMQLAGRRAVRLIGVISVTVGLLVGTVLPAAAADQVPFRSTYSGAAVFTSQTTVSLIGRGQATYLGRSSNSGLVVIAGSDSSCPGGVANTNTETFTAANGDTLEIVSTDVACPIPGATLRFHGTGTWVVIGGSGRFTGASGSGTLDGISDFAAGTFQITLDGTISRPNSGSH